MRDMFGQTVVETPEIFEDRVSRFTVRFYTAYPLKRGKGRAYRAVAAAFRRGATEDQIMDGLDRYKAHKESFRAWMHPATFLNGQCYLDEYDATILKFEHLDGESDD